jgi:hypothetical protein
MKGKHRSRTARVFRIVTAFSCFIFVPSVLIAFILPQGEIVGRPAGRPYLSPDCSLALNLTDDDETHSAEMINFE